MVKQVTPVYDWDPETGVSTCIIMHNGKTHIGIAKCRPEDRDMMGEKTGCTIAEMRAELDYLRSIRDDEIKPKLEAYKTLYYSINQSNRFNPNSYETHMLLHKIEQTAADLDLVKSMIKNSQEDLHTYMKQKAETWKKIRRHREEDKTNQICLYKIYIM